MNTEVDEEGYEVVRPKPAIKGRKCGLCGMKFEAGKSYGFHCSNHNCPCGWGS